MEYNVYCDESCHLPKDNIKKMMFGCIWLPRGRVRSVSDKIKQLKHQHHFYGEIKWNKVSQSKLTFYLALIELFWNESNVNYRGLVVNDKDKLNHEAFNHGSHNSFYYKMFYQALTTVVEARNIYNVYLDIKDTESVGRVMLLREILCSRFHDHTNQIIPRIQQIRSEESVLMQLCDLLTGAIGYVNRGLTTSVAKTLVAERLTVLTGQRLDAKSYLAARKFNIFLFEPRDLC